MMAFEVRAQSDVYVIQPQGRLDASNISDLKNSIYDSVRNGRQRILLDLSQTRFLSSSSVRMLIEIYQDLLEQGGKMGFLSPNENVQDLFHVVMLDKVWPVYRNNAEAMDFI